jgi:hypothetical protein
VWWFAGGHVDPDTDVMVWINEIVRQRVANSRSPASPPAEFAALTPTALTAIWAYCVEVKPAGLFGPAPRAVVAERKGDGGFNRSASGTPPRLV